MYYHKNDNGALAASKHRIATMTEITSEEYTELVDQRKKKTAIRATLMERTRPLTEAEVSRMLITQQVNTLSVDDNTALRMLEFYPEWAAGNTYSVGCRVQYGGKLWRVVQAHTGQSGWEPVNAASLWEQVNETHEGTQDAPSHMRAIWHWKAASIICRTMQSISAPVTPGTLFITPLPSWQDCMWRQ